MILHLAKLSHRPGEGCLNETSRERFIKLTETPWSCVQRERERGEGGREGERERDQERESNVLKSKLWPILHDYMPLIWGPAVLLCCSITWVRNQKLQGAELRLVSCFVTEILYQRKLARVDEAFRKGKG